MVVMVMVVIMMMMVVVATAAAETDGDSHVGLRLSGRGDQQERGEHPQQGQIFDCLFHPVQYASNHAAQPAHADFAPTNRARRNPFRPR